MKNSLIAFSVVACVCLASDVLAGAEAQKEDLSACKLPHGELVIPDRNTQEGRAGHILRLSDGTLNPSPLKAGERPRSVAEFLARIAAEKAGDLMYSSLNDGTLVAVSGRVSDLGDKFLHEFTGVALERPQPVQGVKERSASGEGTPGAIEGILDGHCYLIEAGNGKFALVRVVQKRGRLALIQYVYQPNGMLKFDIPEGDTTAVPRVAHSPEESKGSSNQQSVKPPIGVLPLNPADFVKASQTHLQNQKMIVKLCITLISSKDADLSNRHVAAILLGQLRAVEGAAVLASHIEDNLALRSTRIVPANSYRCAQALIDIGIPGACASIDQIEADAKSEPPKGKESDLLVWKDRLILRRNLLALVVLRVYEEKLAKIVLEDKIAASDDPKVKDAYRNAIEAFPRVKAWLPDVKQQTTMPAATGPIR